MDLSQLTTLRVGGAAEQLVEPTTAAELIDIARDTWATAEGWFVLGGGSNVVISDAGFPGTVIRVATRGIEQLACSDPGTVLLRVQAGEPWDDLVAHTVAQGFAGIEALSGIPGSTGAAPIQNIGAYGQELSTACVSVEFLDYLSGEVVRLVAHELDFGYRQSALKAGRAGIVLSVDFRLSVTEGALSDPIEFEQLATALGVEIGTRLPLAQVREAVLALRSAKGMILDPADPNSVSAGSFFTNPIVSRDFARSLPAGTPRWPVDLSPNADAAPALTVPLESFIPSQISVSRLRSADTVKLSAAWLIEHSGVTKGFSLPGSRAAISGKHSLAIVNTGGATAEQIVELARYVQTRVLGAYGVILRPEPVLVGVQI